MCKCANRLSFDTITTGKYWGYVLTPRSGFGLCLLICSSGMAPMTVQRFWHHTVDRCWSKCTVGYFCMHNTYFGYFVDKVES